MKIRMFLAAIVTLFGFVSHATVVSTVVWTNNLDTVQNGYSITLGEGCIISDGAAVIGSSGGISIDLDNRPAAVSVLIKYSNCQPQSNSAIAISTYIQSTSGSSTHELGVRSNGGNTRNVTGYWQSGPNYSFGDVTLPESGYMLFSTSASVGTKVYAGFEISSLAGGENSTLHFSNTGVGRIMIGAATGTQSSVPYFSWNGLVIEQIAVFENCYLSSADVVNFDFATGKVVPVPTFTVENGVLTKVVLNGATEVVIPEKVSSIGANAFYNCIELASVTIPNSVTNIGSFAFQNCMRLSKVSLPESIVSVGECSFAKGTAVETFEVSENNPVYKALNGLLCTKDGTVVVACPTGLKEVVVPQGVREIARFAFEYCSVTNVTLPEGLEVIGFYGMGHCDALKSVTLPASLISVDDTSFAYDYELESIDVAAGSESFRSEDGILYDKAMTQLICVPPAYGDPVLIVPDGVTTIRSLESCKNIESVIMPNSVIALKSWAFDNCSSLTNIVLSQSLTEISHCAFRFCYALSEIVIPNGVTSISSEAFYSCTNLTRVLCPSSISSIDSGAFLACPMLESVVIDKRDESILIGPRAFSENTSVVMKPEEGFAFAGWNDSNGNRVDLQGITSGYVSVWPSWKAEVLIYDISAKQRYPWNGLVDITCRVAGIVGETNGLKLAVAAVMPDNNIVRNLSHVWLVQDGTNSSDREVHVNGNYRLLWDARADLGTVRYTNMVVRVSFDEHDKVQLWEGGPYWATTNIGADEPEDYGYYFWWGDTVGYVRRNDTWVAADGSTSEFSFISDNTPSDEKGNVTLQSEGWVVLQDDTYVLAPEHDAAQVLWGGGWRTPTDQELDELCYNKCDWTWTTRNGSNGYLVSGRDDYASASIFLPAAGIGEGTSLSNPGSYGAYESSVPLMSDRGFGLGFHSYEHHTGGGSRYYGRSIRPVQALSSAMAVEAVDSAPFLLDTAEGTRIGKEGDPIPITYSPLWCDEAACTLLIDGDVVLTGSEDGEFGWVPDSPGVHVISLVSGDVRMDTSFNVIPTNVVFLHECEITDEISWDASKVYVVDGTISVASGAVLTIPSGTVVKFAEGASLQVAAGGCCIARGTIFTHIADDTVGGDSMGDEDATLPIYDQYSIDDAVVGDDKTELRYLNPVVTVGGVLSGDVVWWGRRVYHITSNVDVSAGSKLTVTPGTVLKFAAGVRMNVYGGLDVKGARYAPVVFTSIKDDEFCGDTNGDGDATWPEGGDWDGLWIYGGKADLSYARLRYSGSINERGALQAFNSRGLYDNSNNSAVNAEISMNGCEIAHSKFDGIVNVTGGNICVTNTVIFDVNWATGPFSGPKNEYVNCVFYGNNVGLCYWNNGRWRGTPVYRNCVFADCINGWCETALNTYGDPINPDITISNCLFWNEPGYGSNGCARVGYDGNIWGDPLFVDPDNDDFRIVEGSPCVDAADTASAPELDYFGQPRVHVPDVGICEVIPRGVTSGIDLVPQNVVADETVVPGRNIVVTWSVQNIGGFAVGDAWRDTVSLVSESGQEVILGEATGPTVLPAGGSVVCSGNFIVPAIPEGKWYPKVNVNSYHDVFEGSLDKNNALVGDRAVVVGLDALDPSAATEGVLNSGIPTILKLVFDEADENRMVKLDLPTGVKVTWGFGFMPQGASKSGSMVAAGDGVMFKVPDDATEVYVVLESDATTTYNLFTEPAQMVITGVSPATLPSSGTTTLTIKGAGFGDENTVTLLSSAGSYQVPAIATDDFGNLIATVDCAALKSGQTYSVLIVCGEGEAEFPSAVSVTKTEGKGVFWARLELPDFARQGREFCAYLEYGNSGNADLAPRLVTIESETTSLLSLGNDEPFAKSIAFYAAGDLPTPSVIKAGDSFRQPIKVICGSSNCFRLMISDGDDYGEYGWLSRSEYEADVSEAVRRLALSGCSIFTYTKVLSLATDLRNGIGIYCIAGRVINHGGVGVPDVLLRANGSDGECLFSRSANNGMFAFTSASSGQYVISVANGATLSGSPLTVEASNKIINEDLLLTVNVDPNLLLFFQDAKSGDINISVRDTEANNSQLPVTYIETDGTYAIWGVTNYGTYSISATYGTQRYFTEIALSPKAIVYLPANLCGLASVAGVVEDVADVKLPDEDVVVEFMNLDSIEYYYANVSETGEYSFAEIPSGKYSVTVRNVSESYDTVNQVEVLADQENRIDLMRISVSDVVVLCPDDWDSNIAVVLSDSMGVTSIRLCNLSGRVSFDGIANGVWKCRAIDLSSGESIETLALDVSDFDRTYSFTNCTDIVASASYMSVRSSTRPMLGSIWDSSLRLIGEAWTIVRDKTAEWIAAQSWAQKFIDLLQSSRYTQGTAELKESLSLISRRPQKPNDCPCGYNMAKYESDILAYERFVEACKTYNKYVQDCDNMKAIANSFKLEADVAETAGKYYIKSKLKPLEDKFEKAIKPYEAFASMPALAVDLTYLLKDGSLMQQLKKLDSAFAKFEATLKNASDGMAVIDDCAEFVKAATEVLENDAIKKVSKVKGVSDWIKTISTYLEYAQDAVRITKGAYDVWNDWSAWNKAAERFDAVHNQFATSLARFRGIVDHVNMYHDNECKAEDPNPPLWCDEILIPDVPSSKDPNEMVGPKGHGDYGTERFVKPGEELMYTIYFENKSDATAAAQEVYVTNPLSEYLDWSTFEMGEVAFNNQIDLGLSGKPSGTSDATMNGTNFIVRTMLGGGSDGNGSIASQGVAHWYMRIVDPTTDTGWPEDITAGFLPPNDETFRGEGHLTYRIKVREDAPQNVVITNSATIVFDYNDPIETDPAWWNTVAPTIGTAKFAGAEVSAEEGGDVVVRIEGGNLYTDSSVNLYLTYSTAAAADLDLAKGAIDGVMPKGGLKFPLTVSWEAGEIGEKVISIPTKKDKAVEDDEFFTLQLAAPVGMELGDARVCTVTIRDPGYYDLEAKIASGTATKAEQTAWDKLLKAKAPYVLGLADPAEAGKVAGSGLCAEGKKVTLKATANKGFVFVGWCNATGTQIATTATLVVDRTAKPAASSATSTTLTGVNEDATYYAKFITVDEDRASITLALGSEELDASTVLETNVTCGVALEWPLASYALSATTVKVAGLPAGLKFTDKDVVDSKTKQVTVPANTIYGAPTAASAVDKNSGQPKPSEVKITVTTAGKSSVTYLVKFTVVPLPAWAVGTFDGEVEGGGIVQAFTVATSGKISGKILEGGKTWTLSAASFDMVEDSSFYATVICKAGKEVVTNEVEVAGTVVKGVEVGVASSDGWSALQNLWSRPDTKAEMPVFKKSFDVTLESGLKLTFKKNGAVSFAGKVEGVSVSGSSQLVFADDGNWHVTLYAPPKGSFPGWCATISVALVVDGQNIVIDVDLDP